MSNPKSKILPGIFSTFVVILMFWCIDAFAPQLRSDLSSFGTNVIGAVLGIITVVAVCVAKRRSLVSIGLIFEIPRIFRGILVGAGMSALPIAIVLAVRTAVYVFLKIPSAAPGIVLPNSPSALSVTSLLFFAASCAVVSLMQELCFRGYMIRSMRPQYPFFDANLLQAGLSTALPLAVIVRNIISGFYSLRSSVNFIVFVAVLIVFYLVYTFVSSMKRGFVTRVSGDIWPSLFGNFFFVFLGGVLFIQNSYINNYSAIICLLSAEIISDIMANIYYRRQYTRNKKRKEQHEKEKLQRIESIHQSEISSDNDPNLEGLSQKSVKEIMEEHRRRIIESVGEHTNAIQPESNDEIASLGEADFQKNINL